MQLSPIWRARLPGARIMVPSGPANGRAGLLPPPAVGKRRHRGLARRGAAVGWWAVFVLPEGEVLLEIPFAVSALLSDSVKASAAAVPASADYSWRRGFFGGERGLSPPAHV